MIMRLTEVRCQCPSQILHVVNGLSISQTESEFLPGFVEVLSEVLTDGGIGVFGVFGG